MPLEGRDGGRLVLGHQAAIPDDIRHQDGGEPALNVCLVHMAPRPKTDFSITEMVKHVLLGVHPWPNAARVAVRRVASIWLCSLHSAWRLKTLLLAWRKSLAFSIDPR